MREKQARGSGITKDKQEEQVKEICKVKTVQIKAKSKNRKQTISKSKQKTKSKLMSPE